LIKKKNSPRELSGRGREEKSQTGEQGEREGSCGLVKKKVVRKLPAARGTRGNGICVRGGKKKKKNNGPRKSGGSSHTPKASTLSKRGKPTSK